MKHVHCSFIPRRNFDVSTASLSHLTMSLQLHIDRQVKPNFDFLTEWSFFPTFLEQHYKIVRYFLFTFYYHFVSIFH